MNKRNLSIFLYSLPVPVLLISLFIGPSQVVSFSEIIKLLNGIVTDRITGSGNHELIKSVVIDVRLPRILLTFITGGALAVSGCSIQAVFRNPLTDPYILGLSSGAAFGAALALAYTFLPVQLSAFLFG